MSNGLNHKFGLIAKEVDSLRKERDELREQGPGNFAPTPKQYLSTLQDGVLRPVSFVKPDKVLKVESTHTLTHEKAIWCVKFSPDGRYLVTGCNDGKARIYDVKTGSIFRVLTDLLTKDPWIRSLCFSPDSTCLATGSNDSLIRIWKIAEKYVRNGFKGHKKRITSLEFSPNGKRLVSASRDNSVRIWNLHDGAVKVFTHENPEHDLDQDFSFYSATLSPSGLHVAAGHKDGAIRIWDVLTGQLVHKLTGHKPWVTCVAFMPDGTGMVSGGGDSTMKYWDLSALEIFRPRWKGPRHAGDRRNDLAKRGSQAEIQPLQQFLGHTNNITSIAMLPTGRWIASSSSDHTVRIWGTHDARLRCVLQAHKNWVWSVDVSPVGNYLASGDSNGTVKIWSYHES